MSVPVSSSRRCLSSMIVSSTKPDILQVRQWIIINCGYTSKKWCAEPRVSSIVWVWKKSLRLSFPSDLREPWGIFIESVTSHISFWLLRTSEAKVLTVLKALSFVAYEKGGARAADKALWASTCLSTTATTTEQSTHESDDWPHAKNCRKIRRLILFEMKAFKKHTLLFTSDCLFLLFYTYIYDPRHVLKLRQLVKFETLDIYVILGWKSLCVLCLLHVW